MERLPRYLQIAALAGFFLAAIPASADTAAGVAAFKKNWGFEGVPLRYAKRVADGETPREMNPMSPKYRLQVALWKKLPLWLANSMGPVIAKGLG